MFVAWALFICCGVDFVFVCGVGFVYFGVDVVDFVYFLVWTLFIVYLDFVLFCGVDFVYSVSVDFVYLVGDDFVFCGC